MNSIQLNAFALSIMLGMSLLSLCLASPVSKTSDEDLIKGTLQQVPRYLMFYHRASPNFKRASSALDTLTGVTLGKRSLKFDSPSLAPTPDTGTDTYASQQQQKSHPFKYYNQRLPLEYYPTIVTDLSIPNEYGMITLDQ